MNDDEADERGEIARIADALLAQFGGNALAVAERQARLAEGEQRLRWQEIVCALTRESGPPSPP